MAHFIGLALIAGLVWAGLAYDRRTMAERRRRWPGPDPMVDGSGSDQSRYGDGL